MSAPQFKVGDRVRHVNGAIDGSHGTIVKLGREVGYGDNVYAIRYDRHAYRVADDFHAHTGDRLALVPDDRERMAFTTRVVQARLNYNDEGRAVSITSGRKGITLSVHPHPMPILPESVGSTNLTAAQAREIANDLLKRAAEIEEAD